MAATARRMTWSQRGFVVEAALVVSMMGFVLRVAGFQRLRAVLERLVQGRAASADVPMTQVLEHARLVNAASRHTLFTNTCLHRSLALWWLLRRRGIDCELRVGARKRDAALEAHAWVEHRGVIVSEDDTRQQDYVPLPRIALGRDA